MAPDVWFAYLLATMAFMIVPGPTVLVVVGYALGRGRRSGWATVPGVLAGDVVAMTASLAGVGAALAASETLFRGLTLAGAAYVVWFGVRMWRSEVAGDGTDPAERSGSRRAMFADSFVVTALNPKSIVFFLAFLPQFLDPDRPLLGQFTVMMATFLILGGFTVVGWIVLAAGFRTRLRNPAAVLVANRVAASLLIGIAVLTLALHR